MNIESFADFFRALNDGRSPFPWQERLARLVCADGAWPAVIDLPTGAGKTACIDIALFHLLASAAEGRPGAAARRVVFVVDRRIVVDEAAVRASRISELIAGATDGVLADAARLLEKLSGERWIEVFTLRGGVPREQNLVRDPATVSVVLSTVDQIGSRLLFRGYGVSDSAKPMHAGMFGFDTLVLLDEAHIAEPFRQTLNGIRREQARASQPLSGVQPLRWTQLSATPSTTASFSLDDADRRHPVLQQRLRARKPMRLVEVAKREELSKKLVELVKAELSAAPLSRDESSRIGIVLNRVASAREAHAALARAVGDAADVHLLIGRIRPLDRDRLFDELGPLLKASANPRPGTRPIVVVATQTIEVGADFDFHSMFVEAASYPALRQRVGRLNRLGLRPSARGAVLLVKAGSEDDPVYGATIARTWQLLQNASSDGVVDLGIEHAPAAGDGTAPTSVPTPELTPSIVHLLAQTSPRPAVDPEIAQFLHGFIEQTPDVSVVWRDGLSVDEPGLESMVVSETLEALPPLSVEAMPLPISSFRSWLRSVATKKLSKVADVGDLEGDLEPSGDASDATIDLPVVVVRDDDVEVVPASRVRPGAVVVVPSSYGGTDRHGFAPDSREPARDLSLEARIGRRATIVFTERIAQTWLEESARDEETRRELQAHARTVVSRIDQETLEGAGASALFLEWCDANVEVLREDVLATVAELRRQETETELLFDEAERVRGIVVRAARTTTRDLVDDKYGLQRTVDVGLDEHLLGVADYAKRFAERVGLRADAVEDLRRAGRLHDLGKADPRFQAMLGAGDGRLLAKGKTVDRRVVLGARHECYSVAVVDRFPELLEGVDADLVRYLVGTHHGRGRGLQPIVEDAGTIFELQLEGRAIAFRGRTELSSVDSGWPELFIRLQRRFGAWGLAYLETVLRLADHRRSEDEVEERDR